MKCRGSGLTDHEWCLQNDIKPGTFYNWVKRFRQKGCTEIPDALNGHSPHRQEIVKIEFPMPGTSESVISSVQDEINQPVPNDVMELSVSGAVLQIPNGTDLVLLRQTLHILKELSYCPQFLFYQAISACIRACNGIFDGG